MSAKLEKIGIERDRARRKRDEWDARFKELDQKYTEQENTEIHEIVHAESLTPEQLAVLLQMAKTMAPNPENLAAVMGSKEKENNQEAGLKKEEAEGNEG